MSIADPSWSDVVRMFRHFADRYNSTILTVPVVDIATPRAFNACVVDWCAHSNLDEYKAWYAERGGGRWERAGKGPISTAYALIHNRAEAEIVIAIWIQAALFTLEHRVPEVWRGHGVATLRDFVERVVPLRPYDVWHHAVRSTLPTDGDELARDLHLPPPADCHDLIKITALCAALSLGQAALVHVVGPDGCMHK
jgi:hypothetical protein